MTDVEIRRFENNVDQAVSLLGGVARCMFLQHAQEYIEELRMQYGSVDESLRNGVKR